MADAGEIKNINTDAIRYVLRKNGTLSKNILARETGLSFPTISRTVDELVGAGELIEKGVGSSTGGRCAQLYAINPMFKVTLCIFVEAQELSWFVNNLIGEHLDSGKETCIDILQTIDTLIMRVQARYPQLGAIAMGLAGNVHQGIVTEASFGYGELRGVNLTAYLNDISGLPAAVEGDMQIVSTGYWARCNHPPKAVACIYLGKLGMGGGIVIEGNAWHGVSAFAGELSYLPIECNLEYAKTHFKDADIVNYYGRIIRSYAALLNPDRIVLYENELILGKVGEIRKECAKHLPARVIPQIELSSEFNEDYERGLAVFASRLLD